MKLCSPSATSRLSIVWPILGNCPPYNPVSPIPTHTRGAGRAPPSFSHTEAPPPGRFTQPLPPVSTRGREGPRPCGPTAPPPIGKFETLVHLLIWLYIWPPQEIIRIILLPRSQPLPSSTHGFLFQLPSSKGSRVELYLCCRAVLPVRTLSTWHTESS